MRFAVGSAFKRHPPVLLALLFGAWVLVTSLLSPDAPVALTGSLVSLGDGAIWMIAMVAVFVLVYIRTLQEPEIARRIAIAVLAAGVILTLAATVEVLLHHGLIYRVADSDLPMVTFPQKGHLAGMIALAGGVALGLAPYVLVPVLAYGVGLCLNRSAGGALIVGALTPLLRVRPALLATVAAVFLTLAGFAGGGIVSKSQTNASKHIVSAKTLESRTYYYRAAVRGIAARPILGWGGGNFEFAWPRFLTLRELNRFGQEEWGFGEVLSVQTSSSGPPVLAVHDRLGKSRLVLVRTFKAHDQILEAALMWGIPGAILYLAVFVLAMRGLRRSAPLAIGILVYGAFTLLWFVIPQTQGLLWAMAAASNAEAHRVAKQ